MSAAKNTPQTRLISEYISLPRQQLHKEFWNAERIEHIRALATSGRAYIRALNRGGAAPYSRLLDRLRIKAPNDALDFPAPQELKQTDTSVDLAYGRIELETPLYLGDMSFGALSGTPNVALARAADLTGTLAGTGEGGLHEEVRRCKRITVQWASARFGVDLDVLNAGLAVVIKIGQGAKPGIGGHLPGEKVTEPISRARRIPAGKDAISPAPHHDIYSIEDLGQRIWALKEATGKPVFVKVGVTNYIPYIASGIARMGADGIIMDGAGAGTGAAPAVVKDNVGLPIDIAVASVDRALREQNLRDGFSVIAAGMVSSPEDTVKLMALGADAVSIGTAALLAMGCVMVHKCHLGFCPTYITNKILPNPPKQISLEWAVECVTNLIRGWTEELRLILRALGAERIRDIVGRREVLEARGLNPETLAILGVEAPREAAWCEALSSAIAECGETEFWSEARRSHLQHLAGTVGKAGGEAYISSMGSTAPLFAEPPRTICDWLRCDGAQVTRPSIDPYREEIETAAYLGGGRIRLSAPILLVRPAEPIPPTLLVALVQAAHAMGLLFDSKDSPLPGEAVKYSKRVIVDFGADATFHGGFLPSLRLDGSAESLRNHLEHLKDRADGRPVFVRLPASEEAVELSLQAARGGADGIILDGDLDLPGFRRLELEVTVSEVDEALREAAVNPEGDQLRERVSVIAEGSRVRGADDIFKIVGLGADAVGISKAALIAVGYEPSAPSKFNLANVRGRLENLVFALTKELKLLAGAAGVSSLQSSLRGNRELFRAVDLDPEVRRRLGVKPAGVG